ncbi:MAG: MFS transporter [Acidimicrobiaceae bacterium]|nr:MFS transporter [Acidimicrobiaceae bacterium]
MPFLDRLAPADFRAQVHGPLRRLYLVTLINTFGNGMAFAMFVVYLHNVRGFSVTFATLLLTATAVVGLAMGPVWGTLIDRIGPAKVGLTTMILSAFGLAAWTRVRTHEEAVITALVITVFEGAGWGPGLVMLTRLVSEDHRQRAYGLNFMMVNLGIGSGLLVSAAIVSLRHPVSFTYLYLFDAAVTMVAASLFATLLPYGQPVHETHEAGQPREGWRVVLRDRRLRLYVVASLVLILGGYGSVDAGLSLFIVNNLHVSIHVIGITFFFNTATIVLAQLWVLNRMQGHSRTRMMALVAVLWFIFWAALESSLALPGFAIVIVLCAAQVVFAIGETMLQPSGSAIVNHIAPEHLRGRYNAAAGAAWGVSNTLAPAITGLYYVFHAGNWWPIGTGVTALVGGLLMLRLRHGLSAAEDGRTIERTA